LLNVKRTHLAHSAERQGKLRTKLLRPVVICITIMQLVLHFLHVPHVWFLNRFSQCGNTTRHFPCCCSAWPPTCHNRWNGPTDQQVDRSVIEITKNTREKETEIHAKMCERANNIYLNVARVLWPQGVARPKDIPQMHFVNKNVRQNHKIYAQQQQRETNWNFYSLVFAFRPFFRKWAKKESKHKKKLGKKWTINQSKTVQMVAELCFHYLHLTFSFLPLPLLSLSIAWTCPHRITYNCLTLVPTQKSHMKISIKSEVNTKISPKNLFSFYGFKVPGTFRPVYQVAFFCIAVIPFQVSATLHNYCEKGVSGGVRLALLTSTYIATIFKSFLEVEKRGGPTLFLITIYTHRLF